MPAVVASRARDTAKAAKPGRDALPPAKKPKLSQSSNGLHALLSAPTDKKPAVSAKLNGVRNNRKDKVQEATAIVTGGHAGHGDVAMADAGAQVIEISSAEEESEYSSLDEQDAEVGAQEESAAPVADGPVGDNEASPEPEEMSFGDRLRAQAPEEIDRAPQIVDVDSNFVGSNADSRALATATINQPLAAPSATSLGTVLTQALRTNDQELLDSCLRVNDVETVYATIERLPSPLVGTLLQKLAERLHKRPGRPGMLMVWVQWSLSAHGGYLATQPQLVKQLATLNKVLKERASGLQPLLALKGRLDMLHTQLDLRRRNQKRAANDDMDEAVIYVEGEEESSADDISDEEDAEDNATGTRKRLRHGSLEDDDSSADEMPTTMEVDEDSEGSEDSEDMIDDEAEETDDDTGDDISEEMEDDVEDDGGASESEDDSRPARRSTTGRARLGRRS
ncbi:NUC189-domain-containing protein [Periconia macrospinosa]|uniref:NUC189-domain-containing protein n=1 Tax=Periconia macrospinosa TaxID=97972 RepID=A0A2V1EA85_9PLEO|nr:NUC189-domain-containing protein [Periconia macrospinosa]